MTTHPNAAAAAVMLVLTSVWIDCPTAAGEGAQDHAKFFENRVRPLLIEHCGACHGETKQKGDFRSDTLAGLLIGGSSGPAVVPGDPEQSLLIEAVRYESLQMPPSAPLTPEQIDVLTHWVRIGAPWPNSPAPTGSRSDASGREGSLFTQEDRRWWALQPVADPAVPAANEAAGSVAADRRDGAGGNPIDRFIAASRDAVGLTAAPAADPQTLVRRLYFDVTGLPPTPDQIRQFITDDSDDAYERLVDRLLDSREHAEHAARQWLDLVRYADTDGYRADGYRDNAWRYRDYVIDSFHADKPYDRFVQEQIAADELFPDDGPAQVGLGYLRHWVYEWNIRDAPGQWRTILDDVTDTTADVFLGLGLQCAKCHNHKFDPLLQKDYFRLQAFFAPMLPTDVILADPAAIANHQQSLAVWQDRTRALTEQIARIESPHLQILKDTAINRFPDDIQAIARMPDQERTPYQQQIAYLVQRQVEAEYGMVETKLTPDEKDQVLRLKRQLQQHRSARPDDLPTAMGVRDVGRSAPPTVMPKRDDVIVPPGIPSILDDRPAVIDPPPIASTGRRAALARWLTDPDNPLSTRVIVNRVWQSHFGRGLAANPSDFGRLGDPPSHPELLDHLTTRFVGNRWSLRELRRSILNSATYRQSTLHPDFERQQAIDPANRYYWRGDTRRLHAEQIRDAMLSASGQLRQRRGGPGVLSDSPHRSIYLRVMRNSPDELLGSFDLPLFFSSTASRNTTTTPVQSLLLINSDLMLGHARALADRVLADRVPAGDGRPGADGAPGEQERLGQQVTAAWWYTLGREPDRDELCRSIEFIEAQTRRIARSQSAANAGRTIRRERLPYRDALAVRLTIDQPLDLRVPHADALNVDDFTIESFFQLRSIDAGAQVRTIAAKWDGDAKHRGWGFGVTGQGSRRKPQTLVMQIVGDTAAGGPTERAIFSDHRVKLDTPYYAAASVRLATADRGGAITFHLKDLSNDDEPLLSSEIELDVTGGVDNSLPLSIGRVTSANAKAFDGLIDDLRLIDRAITVPQLLYTTEKEQPGTIAFWRFETDPGLFASSVDTAASGSDLKIHADGDAIIRLAPEQSALVDFCHALLNSNEFLYVD